MLSRRWIRPIASAKRGATEITVTFAESSTGCVSIESVTSDELLGRLNEGAGADREVVDDEGVAIGHLADDLHELGSLTVTLAYLVGDRERCAEPMRESAGTFGKPGVW